MTYIYIDEEVSQILRRLENSPVDSPNKVLRRMLFTAHTSFWFKVQNSVLMREHFIGQFNWTWGPNA